VDAPVDGQWQAADEGGDPVTPQLRVGEQLEDAQITVINGVWVRIISDVNENSNVSNNENNEFKTGLLLVKWYSRLKFTLNNVTVWIHFLQILHF